MNPIVKLTKQGVRDLDSGRKRVRAVVPEQAPAEADGTDAPAELTLQESPAVGEGERLDDTAAASAR
jgi:hypothetical protein